MTPHHRPSHSKRPHHAGGGGALVLACVGRSRGFIGPLEGLPRCLIVAPGEEEEEPSADGRKQSDQRVDDETDQDVDRGPRRVEQREDARSGHRLAEGVELAHRTASDALACGAPLRESGIEDCVGQLPVQAHACPDEES